MTVMEMLALGVLVAASNYWLLHQVAKVVMLLRDIRDGIGKLITFQTGGASPWEMRDHVEEMNRRLRNAPPAATATPPAPPDYD